MKYTVASNGKSKAFEFTIKATFNEFFVVEGAGKYTPPVRPIITVANPPRPYIESINNSGLIKIAFSQDLLIPNFSLYPEFQRAEYMREANSTGVWNQTLASEARRLGADKKKLEEEAIEIINRGVVFVNGTQVPVVQLSIAPSEDAPPGMQSFTYSCVSFK